MTASERIQTHVKAHPGCTSTEIAQALALPGANVAATLSSLANQGQVQRHSESRPIRWTLPGVALPGAEPAEPPAPERSADEIESARMLEEEAREEQRAMAAAEEDEPDGGLESEVTVPSQGTGRPREKFTARIDNGTGEDLVDGDPEPEGDILPVASEIFHGGTPAPRDRQLVQSRPRSARTHSDQSLEELRKAIALRLDELGDPLMEHLINSYVHQVHAQAGLD